MPLASRLGLRSWQRTQADPKRTHVRRPVRAVDAHVESVHFAAAPVVDRPGHTRRYTVGNGQSRRLWLNHAFVERV
jgi:hypothetical protein